MRWHAYRTRTRVESGSFAGRSGELWNERHAMAPDAGMRPASDGWSRRRIEQSPIAQTACDLDGVLTDVNDAFCRLVDRTAAELLGIATESLTHRTDSGEADTQLAQLLRGELARVRAERVLSGPLGRPVPTLVGA